MAHPQHTDVVLAQQSRADLLLRWRLALPFIGVVFGYAVLASAVTYPILHPDNFSTRILGGGDSAQNLWNVWWVSQGLAQGKVLPLYTRMIYWPSGVTLSHHPLEYVLGVAGYGLQRLGFSLVEAYNLVTWLTFFTSGLGAFALAYYLTRRTYPAFVGGVIYAFAPIAVHRLSAGNLGLHNLAFVPLSALLLLLFLRRRHWAFGLAAVLCVGVSAYANFYLLLGEALLLSVLTLGEVARQRSPVPLLHALLVAGGALLIGAPFLLRYAADAALYQDQANQLRAAAFNNADLIAFFTPDPVVLWVYRSNPEVAGWIGQIRRQFYGNIHEKTVFVGFATLLLLILTARAWVTRGRVWWIAALMFFVLSLGPTLYVLGRPVLEPMPYAWLHSLPLLSFGRTPSRMGLLLMLCLGMLAAIGLAQAQHRAVRMGLAALSALIVVEVQPFPMRMDERVAQVPSFYREFFADPARQGAILDVPVDLWGADGPGGDYMLYQTVHGQPIVGGYIARTPRSALWPFEELPFVNALRVRIYRDQEPFAFSETVLAGARNDLARLQVRYVILHRPFLSAENLTIVSNALHRALGEPLYADERLVIWDLANSSVHAR